MQNINKTKALLNRLCDLNVQCVLQSETEGWWALNAEYEKVHAQVLRLMEMAAYPQEESAVCVPLGCNGIPTLTPCPCCDSLLEIAEGNQLRRSTLFNPAPDGHVDDDLLGDERTK